MQDNIDNGLGWDDIENGLKRDNQNEDKNDEQKIYGMQNNIEFKLRWNNSDKNEDNITNDLEIYSNIFTKLRRYRYNFYNYFLSLNYNLHLFQDNSSSELKTILNNLAKNKIRKFLLNVDNLEKQDMNLIQNPEFIRLLYISLTNYLIKPQRLLIDDKQYYVACDTYTKTYYICFKHLLMCDIDFYKDNCENNFVNISEVKPFLEQYSIRHKLSFRIYSTRNGVHVFVTNSRMNFKSEQAFKIMTDLRTDFYYILYSKITRSL